MLHRRRRQEHAQCLLSNGAIVCAAGEHPDEDTLFAGSPDALAAVVYAYLPLADAEAAGSLRISGDGTLARRFVDLFSLPTPAPKQIASSDFGKVGIGKD
ncbi:SCP2 sterol-binding domain-containing protein [Sphingomonas sp. CGMCC 1.13654]|uniref:SCP2 sterol-binding domain-containing protein n=1 Tax=Sphingomonas chungangi TaxID=2683589 RepID=A0A838L5D7_9SPHN|nr:SCP2 sterol-binding domain-containing protein [Sphingomonas chungangi]MVW55234.1 hypothetical protein [Sphingomonas chungangi]